MEQLDQVAQDPHQIIEFERSREGHPTLYIALWTAIGLGSALLRIFELGRAPLSPAEVAEALSALTGMDATASAALSGLLSGANALLFWLLGATDATARLLPAVAGTLLPLTLVLYSRSLGRRAALFAAAILALSPTLTFFSRSSSGIILGATAALILLGALLRYRDSGESRWILLAGAAGGLGIASGGAFVGLALALILASLGARSTRLLRAWSELGARGPLLAAVAALVLSSTMFFFHAPGLGIVGDGLMSWLAGFGFGWAGRSLGILVTYELLPLLFGLAGAATLAWRGFGVSRTLTLWALSGLVLLLLRPDQSDGPILLVIPLSLLAGSFLDSVLTGHRERTSRLVRGGSAAAVAILGTHIFLSLGQYAHHLAGNPERATASLLLAAVSAILLVGLVLLIWTYDWLTALGGLTAGMLVLLSLFSWGKAWELGHTHQADPRELWVQEASAPGVRILVETLNTASERATASPYTIPLTVQSGDPLLRWYLRDFTTVTWVEALQAGVISEAVIAPLEEADPLLGDNYLGMDLDLRLASPASPGRTAAELLRWQLLRNPAAGGEPRVTSRVVVWLRQDITLVSDDSIGTP